MEPATQLCRSCGLCCNGTLVDYVPVGDAEMQRLARLGIAVRRGTDGAARFDQPCAKFCGECSVYESRPDSCRSYRCELLKQLQAGGVSLDRACNIVREAKDMIVAAERRLGGRAQLLPMDWTKLFDTWQAAAPDERQESDSRLILEQTRLQRFLDLHFRSRAERKLIGKA
jgi:Fe-S-cluster containining protein